MYFPHRDAQSTVVGTIEMFATQFGPTTSQKKQRWFVWIKRVDRLLYHRLKEAQVLVQIPQRVGQYTTNQHLIFDTVEPAQCYFVEDLEGLFDTTGWLMDLRYVVSPPLLHDGVLCSWAVGHQPPFLNSEVL